MRNRNCAMGAMRNCGMRSTDRLPANSALGPTPHSPLPIPHCRTHPPPTSPPSISRKTTARRRIDIPVLTGVNLEVRHGEFLAIVGQSGSRQKHAACICWERSMLRRPAKFISSDKRIDNLPCAAARTIAERAIRHDLPVLSPAAGADDAGKRAGAADDRPQRLELLAQSPPSMSSEPSNCWKLSD